MIRRRVAQAIMVLFMALPLAAHETQGTCEQLLRTNDPLVQAYTKLILAAGGGAFPAAEAKRMLAKKDPFAIDSDGPSQRIHVARAMATLKQAALGAGNAEAVTRRLLSVLRAGLAQQASTAKNSSVARKTRTKVVEPGRVAFSLEKRFSSSMPKLATALVELEFEGAPLLAIAESRWLRDRGDTRIHLIKEGRTFLELEPGTEDPITLIAASPKRDGLLVALAGTELLVWNLPNPKPTVFYAPGELAEQRFSTLSLNAEATHAFVTSRPEKAVHAWDLKTGEMARIEAASREDLLWGPVVAMSLHDNTLAVLDSRGGISQLSSEGARLKSLRAPDAEPFENNAYYSALSADASLLVRVTGGELGEPREVRVERLADHREIFELPLISYESIPRAVFSPDNRFLALVSNQLLVVPLADGVRPITLPIHQSAGIDSAVFSKDSATLYVGVHSEVWAFDVEFLAAQSGQTK